MNLTLLNRLEDWRLRQHFKRVETILRRRDVAQLSPALQQQRNRHLNLLENYAARGVFPRNHECPDYSPCFIDRDGRICAVAHLMIASGQPELAHKIASDANYTYIAQMNFADLDTWAVQTGLTKRELALMQPGYYFTMTDGFLSLALATWAAGAITFFVNTFYLVRGRNGFILPLFSLVSAMFLLVMGVLCLDSLIRANNLATFADGFPYDLPLRHVPSLALGAFLSWNLAVVVGGVGYYRLREYNRIEAIESRKRADALASRDV